MKQYLILALASLFAVHTHSQTLGDYRSNGAVNFTTTTNWQVLTALPSIWSAATTAPAASLTLANANTISVLSAHTLTYSSNFNFASNTNFTINIVGPIASAGSFTVGYGNGLSTVRIERSANYPATNIFQNHTFRNLLLVGTGATRAFSFTSNLTITNSLNIVSGTLSLPAFNLTDINLSINSAGNITVTGNQTLTRSNITANFSGNSRTLNFQGTLNMSGTPGSSITTNFSGTSGLFQVTGNTSLANSSITANFVDNSLGANGILRFSGNLNLSTNSAVNLSGTYASLESNSNSVSLSASTINLLSSNQYFRLASNSTLGFSNASKIKLLAANGLLDIGDNVTINGANATNYIQLSSTSKVQNDFSTNNNFVFPIGSASNFLPVTVNSLPGGGNPKFIIGVFEGASNDAQPGGPAADKPPIVDAVWTISQDGNNSKNVSLSFGWQTALEGSLFNGLANNQMGVSNYNTATPGWNPAVAGTGNNSSNSFTTGTFSIPGSGAISSFALGQVGYILPLLTRNFTAAANNGQVKLNWTGVATHITAYFEVERSSSAIGKFEKIATIPVTAVGEANYQFVDANPIKPESHYRIKITDERNRVSYTKTLKVNLGSTHFALDNLYPTLTSGKINLLISNTRQKQVRVDIIDQQGRTVRSQSLTVNEGSQLYTLDVGLLAGGQYFLLLNNGAETINSRFIKQ